MSPGTDIILSDAEPSRSTKDPPPRRSAVLAGALSAVLPGLGQVYAGDWRRGLTLLVGIPAQVAVFYGVGLYWLIAAMALVWASTLESRLLAGLRGLAVPAILVSVTSNPLISA